MIFLISLAVSVLFIIICAKPLRAHPVPFYIASALIAAAGTLAVWFNLKAGAAITNYVQPVISRGGLSGALFVIVMVTGALPNGSYLMKKLMPIRGQLSIIACIFTLGHNAAYGKTYFRYLFLEPGKLPVTQQIAAVCSLIMIVIMLPLFVTSFKCVRSKMKLKSWKKLQRAAYAFYALLITHILLLCVPYAQQGRAGYRLTVFIYGSIFLFYLIARVSKYFAVRAHKGEVLRRIDTAILALVVMVMGMSCVTLFTGANDAVAAEKPQAAETAAAGQKWNDGVYEGTAFGNSGYITVRVTLENDRIADITVVSSADEEPYWSWALDVVDWIYEANGTDVDCVTGATFSSGGIIDAVSMALRSAEIQ